MIFDSLVLHNFGLYSGRQEIALATQNSKQPIVLFGGLNGAGKTTILDALQLALYGKLAKPVSREGKSYHEYLRDCIHRGTALSEGAAVELCFTHRSGGTTDKYRLCRSWSENGQSLRERLTVIKNGHEDDALTENWAQHVEGLIPCNVAQLFFFDGEKIAELAESGSTRGFLSTAVRSLLGLDVIEQLNTDLDVVVRRQQGTVSNEAAQKKIAEQEKKLEEVERIYKQLVDACAASRNRCEQLGKKKAAAEDDFRRSGGEAFRNRSELAARAEEKKKARNKLEVNMRIFAEGDAPLCMVDELLAAVHKQACEEEHVAEVRGSVGAMRERDRKVLAFLGETRIADELVGRVQKFMDEDLEARASEIAGKTVYLHAGENGVQEASSVKEGIAGMAAEASEMVGLWRKLTVEIEDIERALQTIPPEEAVSGLLSELEGLRQEMIREEGRHSVLEEQKAEAFRAVEAEKRKLISAIEAAVDDEVQQERAQRTILRSQKVRGVLDKFASRLLETHVARLEALILESFSNLVHKSDLVTRIAIDAKTFEMSLHGADHGVLPIERLSAGERQLLAVAMLWGLARASGRPVPCVIDTPLGRLDSAHRDNLIEIYFPNASHQVLLLSTDEEIDKARLAELERYVGLTYYLDYNDAEKETHVERGYFWGGRKS